MPSRAWRRCVPAPASSSTERSTARRRWKDSRAALLLPFWRAVVPRPRVVICVRNPAEVAASMMRRDAHVHTWEHWLRMWLRHTGDALARNEGSERLVIVYEDLLAAPEREARRLGAFLLGAEPTDEQARAGAAAVRQGVRREHVSDAALAADPRTPAPRSPAPTWRCAPPSARTSRSTRRRGSWSACRPSSTTRRASATGSPPSSGGCGRSTRLAQLAPDRAAALGRRPRPRAAAIAADRPAAIWDGWRMSPISLPALALALVVTLLAAGPASAAKRLKLRAVAGLPANSARDLANGPGKEVWMTSDQTGNFVARISRTGKLLRVVPVPGRPDSITRGPDDAMWFTLRDAGLVGRVTRDGQPSFFPVPLPPGSEPRGIAAGPDGALWVTLFRASAVGRITTSGAWTIFQAELTPGAEQLGITRGPGGLWITEPRADRIAKLTTGGAVTGFPVSNASGPEDITVGFDGNLWFTEDDGDRIGKITPGGKVTEYAAGISPGANPFNITSGADQGMWFTEALGDRIGRATPDGLITEYDLPKGSVPRAIILGPGRKLWAALAGTGRVVRFEPPLAPIVPATITYSASTVGGTTTFSQFRVDGIPKSGRVEVRCSGGRCPARRFTKKGRSRVDLRKRFRRVGVGASLQVSVPATGYATYVRIFKLTSGGMQVKKRCTAPGSKKLRKKCR
jgi:virginiamycin B lyase